MWVPRLLTTFKARAWLYTAGATLVVPAEAWPEIFLMLVQFGGLVLVVWSLGLPTGGANSLTFTTPEVRKVSSFTTPGENFLSLWVARRGSFLASRGVTLAEVVGSSLGGVSTLPVGLKTWFTLREKLRPALLMSELPLNQPRG